MLAITTPEVTSWVKDPRAVALLDSIRRNPPKAVRHFPTFVTTRDEWVEYTGYRVDCLKEIHADHFFAMEAASIQSDAPELMDRFANEPTVQKAVQAVVEGRAA